MPTSSSRTKDQLESWKEIAAFIGRDERTAMRWEELGMPVRRIPGSKRSRVYASRSEIARWRAQLASPPETEAADPPPRPPYSSGESIAPMSAGRRLPVNYWIVAGVVLIQAFDAQGQNIWTHTFPRPFMPGFGGTSGRDLPYFAHIVDLLGDGEPKVLMLAPFFLDRAEVAMEVDCFSSRGDLLWSHVPHESLQFGSRVQPGGWSVLDILVSHDGPKRRIWVIGSDHTWGDSYVAELDPADGRATLRYVNPGTLTMLNEFKTPAASFLLVTGYNNEYSRGTLAAIAMQKSFAASPQTAAKYKCANCPAGEPDYYFVYPQSEINEVNRELVNAVGSVEVLGRQVQISKFELHSVGSMRTIYTLTPENPTAPQSILYSSDYDVEHAELQRNGVIKHSLKECPERMHPKPIRMWSPATGWTELTVTRQ